ncbi:hypothetical protein AAMO2058_000606200 [Amorphochlora amoebiformis]
MEPLVSVEPPSLRITLVRNAKCQGTLQIINNSDKLVVYKVKTTDPGRYAVGNNHGVIESKDRAIVKIVVEPMSDLPEHDIKDKFLVMHMPVGEKPPDLVELWKQVERNQREKRGTFYHQQKVRCRLQLPAPLRAAIASQKGKEQAQLAEGYSANTNIPTPAYDEPKMSAQPAAGSPQAPGEYQRVMSDLRQKREEYEELMTYTVKLAHENESLKKELAKIKEGDGSRTKTISDQKSKIADLQKQLEKVRRSNGSESTIGVTARGTNSLPVRWEYAVIMLLLALLIRTSLN